MVFLNLMKVKESYVEYDYLLLLYQQDVACIRSAWSIVTYQIGILPQEDGILKLAKYSNQLEPILSKDNYYISRRIIHQNGRLGVNILFSDFSIIIFDQEIVFLWHQTNPAQKWARKTMSPQAYSPRVQNSQQHIVISSITLNQRTQYRTNVAVKKMFYILDYHFYQIILKKFDLKQSNLLIIFVTLKANLKQGDRFYQHVEQEIMLYGDPGMQKSNQRNNKIKRKRASRVYFELLVWDGVKNIQFIHSILRAHELVTNQIPLQNIIDCRTKHL